MKLNEIKQIKQTGDEKVVNEYLSKGFEIVRIFSGSVPINEHGDKMNAPIYVLGLKNEK